MSSIESISLQGTSFHFEGQDSFYKGKVRDVYEVGEYLIMVVSDRISAFDHVLPRPIPYKGQVLNQLAAYFLRSTSDIVPNWLLDMPDPNVSIGLKCMPIKVEMVIRGYLAGHAWRTYKSGERILCGITMPEGMKEGDAFPDPIITPSTKAEEGHDEDISKDELIEKGVLTENLYYELEKNTRALFRRGSEMALEQGLILVDTKYEFGVYDGNVYLIDEIHTPDSSRYYYSEGYKERQAKGEKQQQLSKEFVREWLMRNGFQGKDGQIMPEMPDKFVWNVSERYIQLYELLTGTSFEKLSNENMNQRIHDNIENSLSKLHQAIKSKKV